MLLAAIGFSRNAHAVAFYFDLGAGASLHRDGGTFFAAPTLPAYSGISLAGNTGFHFLFSDGDSPLEVQLGVEGKLASGSDLAGVQYETIAPYAVLRLQMSRIFLGFGMTPFVWTRANIPWGFDGLQMTTGSLAYLGELGFLFAGTPKFTASLVASAQVISTGAALSPLPTADLSFVIRLYFDPFGKGSGAGPGGSSSSKRTPNEFKGWRYPFGIQK